MKNKTLNIVFIFLIIAVLVWLAFYLAGDKPLPEEPNLNNNNETSQEEMRQFAVFENYIKSNINEVSTEPAVLGGTFYVTEVNLLDDNLAIVDYEDGHIALKAMIGFRVIDNEVIIDDFDIMPEEVLDQGDNAYNDICVDQCGDGICQEMVCMGEGCPCAETAESCPADCS